MVEHNQTCSLLPRNRFLWQAWPARNRQLGNHGLVFCYCLALLHWGMVEMAPQAQAEAELPAKVQRAIDKGVAYLKSIQDADGQFKAHGLLHFVGNGVDALCGLALLEAGVPVEDPVIQKTARWLTENLKNEHGTYRLALAIMFFDSLTRHDQLPAGAKNKLTQLEPKPTPKQLISGRQLVTKLQQDASELIIHLGKRLLQGQGEQGGWSYSCALATDGDYSNTQFGTIGIWIATMHGLDGWAGLKRCANYFRDYQNPDGGWGYTPRYKSYAAMTAAALLAMATDIGATQLQSQKINRKDRIKDPAVQAALNWLGQFLQFAQKQPDLGASHMLGDLGSVLYTLWSIERVGVFYGLEKFGDIDWYQWGCKLALQRQKEDGSWNDMYSPSIDTCFAILFLRRANIAPELTLALTGVAPNSSDSSEGGPQALRAVTPGTALETAIQDDQRTLLLKELTQAKPERQRQIIDQLTAGKGNDYTNALVQAHLLLDDDTIKAYAAEAMNQRMVRMTAKTLAYKLTESEQLIRLAAIRAVATKQERSLLPNLIELLVHGDTATWQAARDTLRQLSGEDFGPEAESVLQRVQAKRLWSEWWQKQPKP